MRPALDARRRTLVRWRTACENRLGRAGLEPCEPGDWDSDRLTDEDTDDRPVCRAPRALALLMPLPVLLGAAAEESVVEDGGVAATSAAEVLLPRALPGCGGGGGGSTTTAGGGDDAAGVSTESETCLRGLGDGGVAGDEWLRRLPGRSSAGGSAGGGGSGTGGDVSPPLRPAAEATAAGGDMVGVTEFNVG